MKKIHALATVGLVVFAGSAFPSILALYSIPVNTNPAGFETQDTDLTTTASSLSLSNLGTFGAANDGYGISSTSVSGGSSPYHLFIRSDATDAVTEEGALLNAEYMEFTLTPSASTEVTYESLTLNQYTAASSATLFLRSSVDSYENNIDSLTLDESASLVYTSREFSLSGFDSITEAVTFRLYLFDSAGTGSIVNRIDDITLNGTTAAAAVPEASTGVLWTSLMVVVFLYVRRRIR